MNPIDKEGQLKEMIAAAARQTVAYCNDRAEMMRTWVDPQLPKEASIVAAPLASVIRALGAQMSDIFNEKVLAFGFQIAGGYSYIHPAHHVKDVKGDQVAAAAYVQYPGPEWTDAFKAAHPFMSMVALRVSPNEFIRAHQHPDAHHGSDQIIQTEVTIRQKRLTDEDWGVPEKSFPALFEAAWANLKDKVYPKPPVLVYPVPAFPGIGGIFENSNHDQLGLYFNPSEDEAVLVILSFFPDNLRLAAKFAVVEHY